MLSDELRAELALGDDTNESLLVTTKSSKKGKKRSRGEGQHEAIPIPTEMFEKQLYRNAKEKRRLDQITKRKEKESRRDEFLQVLKENEILPQHRALLISGKELGQMHTVKNRLKMVLKRYKAGLNLTSEETELLFPNGQRREDLDMDEVAENELFGNLRDGHVDLMQSQAAIGSNHMNDSGCAGSQNEGTLLDLFAVCAQGPSSSSSRNSKKARVAEVPTVVADSLTSAPLETVVKKINPASIQSGQTSGAIESAIVQPSITKASVASSGLSLAAQLQQLKQTLSEAAPTGSLSTSTAAIVSEEKAAEMATSILRRYVPVSLPMPHSFDYPLALPASSENSNEVGARGTGRNYVPITRPADIQASRLDLPVCAMEQEVVESIQQHDVVILCGETGSGKSTQVPQFCYEYGYARGGMMIGITQPRRVAAVTTADRVSYEMGDASRPHNAKLVGHQIRHDNSTTASTAIKFMTDGILLQEMEQDLLLSRYSVLVIDEAHERGVNSDVLLGMLSRAVPFRRKQFEDESAAYNALVMEERAQYLPPLPALKLVIMSATLRVDDFTSRRLFPPPMSIPPVIQVDARQFPITVHFSRRTETAHTSGAYLKECIRKVTQIHTRLPEGGILVFLTGKREIMYVVNKLRRALSKRAGSALVDDRADAALPADPKKFAVDGEWGYGEEGDSESDGSLSDDDNDEDIDGNRDGEFDEDDLFEVKVTPAPSHSSDGSVTISAGHGAVLPGAIPSDDNDSSLRSKMLRAAVNPTAQVKSDLESPCTNEAATGTAASTDASPSSPKQVKIVPLYAMMSAAQQREIFRPIDSSQVRLIVIATNVAETSITIPNIKYVVDSGREKRRVMMSSGKQMGQSKLVSKYTVDWISQASSDQRKGRAGRTGPGHCYRLFSAAFFEDHMERFSAPQILTVPLEDLVLKMKAIGIHDILSFPFPTAPQPQALRQAVLVLQNIGALSSAQSVLADAPVANARKERLTDLGRKIGSLALPPRLAKMLVMALNNCLSSAATLNRYAASSSISSGREQREREKEYISARELLEHAVGIACILTEKNPFQRMNMLLDDVPEPEDGDDADSRKESKNKVLLWVHRDGDALARNKAFGAYCYYMDNSVENGTHDTKLKKGIGAHKKGAGCSSNKEVTEFCATHCLSEQVLGRAYSLRTQISRQLQQELSILHPSSTLEQSAIAAAASPPSVAAENALLQLLLSGHGDHIARKAPLGSFTTGSRRQRLTAYLSSNPEVHDPVYIHPHSCLYNTDPTATLPEYVAYTNLIRNEANTITYMECVSIINPSWLAEVLADCPLVRFGPFLDSPSPFYDKGSDCVLGYSVPVLGAQRWELAPVQLPLDHTAVATSPDASGSTSGNGGGVLGFRPRDLSYRWFGRLLLENKIPLSGTVLLQDMFRKEVYSESPSSITNCKPNAKVLT